MFGCKRRRIARAFTLVELLTVISIIGVLAAILMPVVSNAIDSAKKLRASRNLRQIAMSYVSFSLKGKNRELKACQSAAEWAGLLSKHEELNVASMFFLGDDYLVESTNRPVPKAIGFVRDGQWRLNPEFENFPLSVVVIAGI
ncbi:MAG: type II secretion system GspH family protein, partial [Puniceicoccales bacterium]|nr:type II secretion system GspH family protein [Puniceicoccales bacterium]